MTHLAFIIVPGVAVACLGAALGWLARTHLWQRRLRRKQAFFGLPDNSESLLVVNREAGGPELTVLRHDVFALLELAALIKDCNANAQVVAHDAAQQGFGERTEFCVGGPGSNRRMAAHLASLLPGVRVNVDAEAGPDRGAFQIGGERHRLEPGRSEYVILARLTAGQRKESRPVFLFCGQRAITNQAAARYLARNHERLARKHGNASFALLLKVVNSQAYGPDVVELVADVTRAAQAPLPAAEPEAGDTEDTAKPAKPARTPRTTKTPPRTT
ncbi:hypothetical protein ACWCQK_02925 [Streptomyces sp. NPDC002306]